MSFAPTLLLWIALILAAVLSWVLGRRSRAFSYLVPAVLSLSIPLFIFLSPDTPPALGLGGWQFALPVAVRQLSAIAALLGLAALLPVVLSRPEDASRKAGAMGLLVLTSWVVGAAADLFTIAAATTLFALAWLWVLGLERSPLTPTEWLRRGLWLFTPPFALWLAAGALGLGSEGSATLAAGAVLLAGWLAGGAWPFGGWRLLVDGLPVSAGVLLLGLPAIVAGMLLLPLTGEGGLGSVAPILATIGALVGLAVGLRAAWAEPMGPSAIASGLGLSLAGLVPAAAVWAGEPGLIAAVRLAAFAPAVLMLAGLGYRQDESARLWRPGILAALLATLAAVAALPFTVGFGVLAPLYSRWSSGTALLLVLVLAVLMMAWIAAFGYQLLQQRALPAEQRGGLPPAALAGLVVGVLGLIWIDVDALTEATPIAWVALAVSLVGGLVLPRFLVAHDAWREALRGTLTVEPEGAAVQATERLARTGVSAAADAVALLEGDYGLVWLLAVLGLLLLFG